MSHLAAVSEEKIIGLKSLNPQTIGDEFSCL
jgi:hypothetical protein